MFGGSLQGEEVLSGLDIAKESGGTNRVLVKEFKGVGIADQLKITLSPEIGRAILCGVAIGAEN